MTTESIPTIFIAYSHKDKEHLEELRTFLSPLTRNKKVNIWYDGEIRAGAVWDVEIKTALHNSDIILLLVSPNSLNSDYFYDKEVADALERHRANKARVIPIILNRCLWDDTPLHEIQVLPKGAKPIAEWDNKNSAWDDVARGIKSYVEEINSLKKEQNKKLQEQALLKQREEDEINLRAEREKIEQENKAKFDFYTSTMSNAQVAFKNQYWDEAKTNFEQALNLWNIGYKPSKEKIVENITLCVSNKLKSEHSLEKTQSTSLIDKSLYRPNAPIIGNRQNSTQIETLLSDESKIRIYETIVQVSAFWVGTLGAFMLRGELPFAAYQLINLYYLPLEHSFESVIFLQLVAIVFGVFVEKFKLNLSILSIFSICLILFSLFQFNSIGLMSFCLGSAVFTILLFKLSSVFKLADNVLKPKTLFIPLFIGFILSPTFRLISMNQDPLISRMFMATIGLSLLSAFFYYKNLLSNFSNSKPDELFWMSLKSTTINWQFILTLATASFLGYLTHNITYSVTTELDYLFNVNLIILLYLGLGGCIFFIANRLSKYQSITWIGSVLCFGAFITMKSEMVSSLFSASFVLAGIGFIVSGLINDLLKSKLPLKLFAFITAISFFNISGFFTNVVNINYSPNQDLTDFGRTIFIFSALALSTFLISRTFKSEQ